MTKISNEEAYSIKPIPLETDIVFGTDKESSVKFSKNFQLGDLRSFFLAGLDPETGGTLKIHEIVISTLATDIATTVNQMVSTYTVSQYEVLFFRVAGKLYVLKSQDVTIGLGQPSLSNSDFIEFPTSVGPTGPAGTNGTNGIDGTNGSVWRTASGAPSNSLGVNGDYYLNSVNGDVYTKTSGTYAVVANIKGSNGNDGNDGLNAVMTVSSSTVVAIASGTNKTFAFTQEPNLGWTIGTRLRAYRDVGQYMEGAIVSFTDTSVTIFADYAIGTGSLNGWNIGIAGDRGQDATADNLQRVITGNTTLSNTDNNYSIIINNGASNITITVPHNLVANFECGFVQKGSGDVTFAGSGGATLLSASGLKIKGQNQNAYLIKQENTTDYFLIGNLKA